METKLLLKYDLGINQTIQEKENSILEIKVKDSNFSSNREYLIKFSDLRDCLLDNGIIIQLDDSIGYTQEDQKKELCKDGFILIHISRKDLLSQSRFQTNIVLNLVYGLKNKLQKMEQTIQKLVQTVALQSEKIEQLQKNEKKSTLDILFLIGLPKEKGNNVICQKEILKIQRVLREYKIDANISITQTKEGFKRYLKQNPKIIHVICHGVFELIEKDSLSKKYSFFLEIEDQKGGEIKLTVINQQINVFQLKIFLSNLQFTHSLNSSSYSNKSNIFIFSPAQGQELLGMIDESNCFPELVILNSCHSQGVYNDMQRVYSDKMFYVVAVNKDFPISNIYALKFIYLFYKMMLNSIQKQEEINWVKIIKTSKKEINSLQIKNQSKNDIFYLCCEDCPFQRQCMKSQQCDCFKTEREMSYQDFQKNDKCKDLFSHITKEEFTFLRRFVSIHQSQNGINKDGKCFLKDSQIMIFSFLPKHFFALNCSKYFKNTKEQIGSVNLKTTRLYNYFYEMTTVETFRDSQLIYLTYIFFYKKIFLEAERYVFNSSKNFKNQLALRRSLEGKQMIINGVDFLTTSYPKSTEGSFKTCNLMRVKNTKRKQRKESNIVQHYLFQSKGTALKHLQNKIMKNNYNNTIPMFNISQLENNSQLKRVFLVNFQNLKKHIDNNSTKVRIFYLYSWCKENEIVHNRMNKMKKLIINIDKKPARFYLHSVQEHTYEDSLLYFQDIIKESNSLPPFDENNSFGYNEEEFTKAFEFYKEVKNDILLSSISNQFTKLLNQKIIPEHNVVNSFEYVVDTFKQIQQDRNTKSQQLFESIKDEEKIIQSGRNKILQQNEIELINKKLLHLINPSNYKANKPLYKYLQKICQMNICSLNNFLHKKSLTRCLLKIIIAELSSNKTQVNLEDFSNIFYEQQIISDQQIQLDSLKSIYQALNLQYYQISPCFKELVRSIILNQQILFDRDLVQSYLVCLEYSQNAYKTFRDLIKIHKKLINQENSLKNQQEIELLLNHLKIQYYFDTAKQNPNYENLYVISSLVPMKAKKTHKNTMNNKCEEQKKKNDNNSLEKIQKNENISNNLQEKQMVQIQDENQNSKLKLILKSRVMIQKIESAKEKLKSSENVASNIQELLYILKESYLFNNKILSKQKEMSETKDLDERAYQISQENSMIYLLLNSSVLTELVNYLSLFFIPPQQLCDQQLQKESSEENSKQHWLHDNQESIHQYDFRQKLQQLNKQIQDVRKCFDGILEYKNKKCTILSQLALFCLESYYQLEFKIEECLYKQGQQYIFGDLEDFYLSQDRIFKIVNEFQSHQKEVEDKLIEKIINSLLSVQYYFVSSRNNLNDYLKLSIELNKDIYSKCNRILFTTKLLTENNILQNQQIQNSLKKIIIVDQDKDFQDLKQLFPIITNIYDRNQFSNISGNLDSQIDKQNIELLIYLNALDIEQQIPYQIEEKLGQSNSKETYFQEKKIIYFDINLFGINDTTSLKTLQHTFLISLLNNVLKGQDTYFSDLISISFSEMKKPSNITEQQLNKFKESIIFQCNKFESERDTLINSLCYQFPSKIKQKIFLEQLPCESIDEFIKQCQNNEIHKNDQLKEIFGQISMYNIAEDSQNINDQNFSLINQQYTDIPQLYDQNQSSETAGGKNMQKNFSDQQDDIQDNQFHSQQSGSEFSKFQSQKSLSKIQTPTSKKDISSNIKKQ